MGILLPLLAISVLIASTTADKCDVLSLEVRNAKSKEFNEMKVVGAATHASCFNNSVTLRLSNIDPLEDTMKMRIKSTKDRWLITRFTKVGDHKVYWPNEVKMSFVSANNVLDEIHMERKYKKKAKHDFRTTNEDIEEGYFTFSMTKEHAKSLPQQLVQMETKSSVTSLFTFVYSHVLDEENLKVLANVKCGSAITSLDINVELKGVKHGRLMTSHYEKQLPENCKFSDLDCVYEGKHFENVKNITESYDKFLQCFKEQNFISDDEIIVNSD